MYIHKHALTQFISKSNSQINAGTYCPSLKLLSSSTLHFHSDTIHI